METPRSIVKKYELCFLHVSETSGIRVIVPALHLFIGVLKLCFLYEYFLFQVLEVADHLERSVDRSKKCP